MISIIVPAFNTPEKYLEPLLLSVLGQTYENWELCLVNASTEAERRKAIEAAAKRDKRIRHIPLELNGGIAANTNAGIAAAKGEFIAFLDHDDTLAEFALNEVAAKLNENPELDVFYSDEDKLSDDGSFRSDPFFKPGWSPELFHTANYLAHFVVVRSELVTKVQGIRTGYDGAQDFDFLLRIFDLTDRICHIPHISYHWRMAVGSTAKDTGEKTYADDAGQRALKDYVKRNSIDAEVTSLADQATYYRITYRVEDPAGIVRLGSLEELDMKNLREDSVVIVGAYDGSSAELLQLAAMAAQPGVGFVGAKIITAGHNGPIGYCLDNGKAKPFLTGLGNEQWSFTGPPGWPRNILIPNPDLFAVSAKVLSHVPRADFGTMCLSAHSQGYRNVYYPYVVKNAPRLSDISLAADQQDSYLNPNLTIHEGALRLKF